MYLYGNCAFNSLRWRMCIVAYIGGPVYPAAFAGDFVETLACVSARIKVSRVLP